MDTHIKALYKKIINLDSLMPSLEVNTLFTDLVSLSLSNGKLDLNDTELSTLQRICSESEYELEKYWCQRIIDSEDPQNEIQKFPYIKNYNKLTKMEWHSLLSCSEHKKHNVLFVGGGPLPLSAIILALTYEVKVTIVEKELDAAALSRRLIKLLHLEDKIRIVKVDAINFDGYQNYNVIFVAALAGIDVMTKTKIILKIRGNTKKGSHILARSSWGTRKLLYKPLDRVLYKDFNPVIEVRPHNDIVNSIVIFEV